MFLFPHLLVTNVLLISDWTHTLPPNWHPDNAARNAKWQLWMRKMQKCSKDVAAANNNNNWILQFLCAFMFGVNNKRKQGSALNSLWWVRGKNLQFIKHTKIAHTSCAHAERLWNCLLNSEKGKYAITGFCAKKPQKKDLCANEISRRRHKKWDEMNFN